MSLVEDAKKHLGQCFMIGFEGRELSNETAAFFSQAAIGGTILFAHNYESPAQIAELSHQIQGCRSDLPLWISVDQEGGAVQRFKKPFTILPSAVAVGELDSPKHTFDLAEMMARELKAVGINLNFCPVADIATNPKNPVIGSRAYGKTEDRVSRMVTAMVRGHLVVGVQPCVKHFPGHGDTSVDSHLELPKVTTTIDALRKRELRPFIRAFKSRCGMVMTSHILNPTIDEHYPATLSSKTLHDFLRKDLRYTRLILSDDMEMKAITDHYGAEDAPRLALQAGCDILIYRSEAAGRHAYSSLARALESGALTPEVVLTASNRIMDFKREALLPLELPVVADVGKVVGIREHQLIVERFLHNNN